MAQGSYTGPRQGNGNLLALQQDLQPLSAITWNPCLLEVLVAQTQASRCFLFQYFQDGAPPDSHVRGNLIPLDTKMGWLFLYA